MPKQETMEAIERDLTKIEDTLDTLERIPRMNLNGTTKNQQILILSTVAVVGVVTGSVVTFTAIKKRLPFRKNKKRTNIGEPLRP